MAITMVVALTGCNDWLDVPVEGKSTSKELFEKGEGYRSVLHGLYINMAEDVDGSLQMHRCCQRPYTES